MSGPVRWFARATVAGLSFPFLLVSTIMLTVDPGAVVAVIAFGLFLAPALLVLAGTWLLDHVPARAAFPRATYEWRQVSNARRLADEARDHATKAAALGLPTGEWTDLAAFWTAWADTEEQDGAAEAAETPVERPKPPKGDAGVGNATRAQIEEISRQIKALEPRKTGVLAAKAAETALPVVRAYGVPRDAVYVHVPTYAVQAFTVPPTSGPRGRKDLVVITCEDRIEYRVGYVAPAPGDTVLAELRVPAHTASITQSMIYKTCPEGLIHTRMMKGAPATEHEVPCDCDEIVSARGDVKHRDRGRGLCECAECCSMMWN